MSVWKFKSFFSIWTVETEKECDIWTCDCGSEDMKNTIKLSLGVKISLTLILCYVIVFFITIGDCYRPNGSVCME